MIKSIKMFALSVVMVLSLSGISIACAENNKGNDYDLSQGQAQGQLQGQAQLQVQGQAQSSVNNNDVKNDVKNTNTNNNDIRNTNTNFNTNNNVNTNTNLNNATAVSGSVSGAVSGAKSNNSFKSNISISNVEERELLAAPQISPFSIPILQGGKIGDMTEAMPNFASPVLTKLTRYDYIVGILDVYYGSVFSRITYDELESYLLKKSSKYDVNKKIRYSVKYQDSVMSGGVGGGVAGSLASSNGLESTTGSILPGIHRSTANPIFIITFYEVK